MRRAITLCWLLLTLSIGLAHAATVPQDVVEDTSTRILEALRQNRAAIDRDPNQIYTLVNRIVLPNFDFELMARWVLGRAWQQATPDQRRQFIEEFQTLLVRTYGKTLLEYADEKIQMSPQNAPPNGDEVTVRTEIRPKTGQPMQINYSMHLSDGAWKVYDVTVDGISLVTSYRSSFASQIRTSGMDGVIADLRQRNAQTLR